VQGLEILPPASRCPAGDDPVAAAAGLGFAGRGALARPPRDDHLARAPRVPVAADDRITPPGRSAHVHRIIGTRVRSDTPETAGQHCGISVASGTRTGAAFKPVPEPRVPLACDAGQIAAVICLRLTVCAGRRQPGTRGALQDRASGVHGLLVDLRHVLAPVLAARKPEQPQHAGKQHQQSHGDNGRNAPCCRADSVHHRQHPGRSQQAAGAAAPGSRGRRADRRGIRLMTEDLLGEGLSFGGSLFAQGVAASFGCLNAILTRANRARSCAPPASRTTGSLCDSSLNVTA
jgi:hypothetical protein